MLVIAGVSALIAVVAGTVIAVGGSSGGDDTEVRILARQTSDGRAEVALQVRDADQSWGETVFPQQRFMGADSEA